MFFSKIVSDKFSEKDIEARNLIPVYCAEFHLGYVQPCDLAKGRESQDQGAPLVYFFCDDEEQFIFQYIQDNVPDDSITQVEFDPKEMEHLPRCPSCEDTHSMGYSYNVDVVVTRDGRPKAIEVYVEKMVAVQPETI